MRLRIELAYDGTDFHGWATQPGLRTVQDTVEEALAQVLRLPRVGLTCAGRTDSGVHARGQVVHCDVEEADLLGSVGGSSSPAVETLVRRLNGVLPEDLRVHRCAEAPAGFDARFSALWRRYAYRIADGPDALDPLARRHVLAWPRRLDLAVMNRAAAPLVGEHDFAAFCRRREGATTTRRLLGLTWSRGADGVVTAAVRADAFCHHMVRSLVGCLVAVGEGRKDPAWPHDVLARRQRDSTVTVLPACGLTLEEVAYPPDDELSHRAQSTRRLRGTVTADLGEGHHGGPGG